MQIEQKQNRVYRPQGVYTLSAEESNQITTELENLITEGGLTPNANVLTQVKDSVNNIVDVAANNLQTQIDAITSASDVFDVVGTYAQLQAYDTSTVPVNDIIKVLQDETRQNAATYYRWSGTAWVYVGQEGPYYTKSEIDADFALKTQLPGLATTSQAGLVKPDGQSIIAHADGTISAASTILAALPLFTCQFSDHLISNPSYLRADTFSWQSGNVYTSAYQHLVNDISSIPQRAYISTSKRGVPKYYRDETQDLPSGTYKYAWNKEGNVIYTSAITDIDVAMDSNQSVLPVKIEGIDDGTETETISGITITFYRADDGHKICLANQEGYVSDLYNVIGVAWYYVLDTANTRFKLPRTKYNVVGLRDTVGNYVEAGLPNISGLFVIDKTSYGWGASGTSGAFYNAGTGASGNNANQSGNAPKIGFDASRSSSVYGNSSTVQSPATQMYLYFYCGNTVINQTTIDVGEITEQLNNKLDIPTGRNQSSVGLLVENYVNGTSWYRVWSDGWCEQGGRTTSYSGSGFQTITLLKPMKDTNYTLLNCNNSNARRGDQRDAYIISNTQIGVGYDGSQSGGAIWKVEGYIS